MTDAGDAALPAPPTHERTVAPVLAVALLLLAVVFGGYAVGGALSTPSGPAVEVAGIVRIAPLSGWEVAERAPDSPGARLTRGSATLDVAVVSFSGSADDLVRAYVEQALDPEAEQLSVSRVEGVSLSSGRTGARVFYVGTFGDVASAVEGQVTAVTTASGVGAVFDGWTPFGLLRYAQGDVEAMVAAAEVR